MNNILFISTADGWVLVKHYHFRYWHNLFWAWVELLLILEFGHKRSLQPRRLGILVRIIILNNRFQSTEIWHCFVFTLLSKNSASCWSSLPLDSLAFTWSICCLAGRGRLLSAIPFRSLFLRRPLFANNSFIFVFLDGTGLKTYICFFLILLSCSGFCFKMRAIRNLILVFLDHF